MTGSPEGPKAKPSVQGLPPARQAAISGEGRVLKARHPWLAYILACIGPVLVWVALGILAPKFSSRYDTPALVGQVVRGGRIGIVLASVLSFAVAAWIHRTALKGGFMAPLAIGFLAKLFTLAGGTMLLWGPLAHWGRPGSFAICFAASAFTFQLTFLPILDRSLQPRA